MKTYPYIEERDYKNRTEFRIVDKTKNDGVDYVWNWDDESVTDLMFTAYKENDWLMLLFFGDYKKQRKKCIKRCRLHIKDILKAKEKPKIKRFV